MPSTLGTDEEWNKVKLRGVNHSQFQRWAQKLPAGVEACRRPIGDPEGASAERRHGGDDRGS